LPAKACQIVDNARHSYGEKRAGKHAKKRARKQRLPRRDAIEARQSPANVRQKARQKARHFLTIRQAVARRNTHPIADDDTLLCQHLKIALDVPSRLSQFISDLPSRSQPLPRQEIDDPVLPPGQLDWPQRRRVSSIRERLFPDAKRELAAISVTDILKERRRTPSGLKDVKDGIDPQAESIHKPGVGQDLRQ